MGCIRRYSSDKLNFQYQLLDRKGAELKLRISGSIISIFKSQYVSEAQVNLFITKNEKILSKHLAKVEKYQKLNITGTNPFIVIRGSKIPVVFQNKLDSITSINSKKCRFNSTLRGDDDFQTVKNIYKVLGEYYKDTFKQYVQLICEEMGVEVPAVEVRDFISRWGVCFPKNQLIKLNIKLVHFPFAVLKYVVIHELTHFKYLNHQVNFWGDVAKHCPDYKKHIAVLRNPGV